jgi:hypothetical protein
MRIATFLGTCASLGVLAPLHAQSTGQESPPSAVVQRFVDAAIARDLDAMIETLGEEVVFAALPTAQPFATGRDSVRAHYARLFERLPEGFSLRVAARIADGSYVTDFEQFFDGAGKPDGQATWIYYVTEGSIQRAWVLRQPMPPGP